MGGDGREPFPWVLIAILVICFCIGFLGGLYAFSWMLP